jgi:D-lactate dehydrogenase
MPTRWPAEERGALQINTSRGGLVDTEAAIEALKSGQLGGIAIDVYEQEAGLFFRDLSSTVITDDVIQRRLLPERNRHRASGLLTREAFGTILGTTLASISDFAAGRPLANKSGSNRCAEKLQVIRVGPQVMNPVRSGRPAPSPRAAR